MLFVYQDSDAAIVLKGINDGVLKYANIAPQMPKRTVRNDGTVFAKGLSAPQRSQKTPATKA